MYPVMVHIIDYCKMLILCYNKLLIIALGGKEDGS